MNGPANIANLIGPEVVWKLTFNVTRGNVLQGSKINSIIAKCGNVDIKLRGQGSGFFEVFPQI